MNSVAAPKEAEVRIPWSTRISYALGDSAQNIVWGAMSVIVFF